MVLTFAVSVSLIGVSCKTTAAAAETTAAAAETTTAAAETTAAAKPFEGVKLTIASPSGYWAEPLKDFIPKWEEKTGAKVEIVEIPFEQFYDKMMAEAVAGSGVYDVLSLLNLWMADYAGPGRLLDLDPYIDKVKEADPTWWEDIHPTFRDKLSIYNGVHYSLVADGDVFIFYYNKDLFNNPEEKKAFEAKYGYPLAVPKNFDQYRDIAQFFTRPKDNLYGVVEEATKGRNQWFFFQRLRALTDGYIYFDPDTMKPAFNTDLGVKALENQIECVTKYAPPGTITWNIREAMESFSSGQVAMQINWPDTGTFANDPKTSTIVGKVGYDLVPGGATMLPGGWTLAIAKATKNPDAAFDLIKEITGPEEALVTNMGPWGHDPWRLSVMHSDEFKNKFEGAADFLKADEANVTSGGNGNGYDLSVPGTFEYYDALSAQIARAFVGEITAKQALDNAAADWEKITDRLGRENQKTLYRGSLGLK